MSGGTRKAGGPGRYRAQVGTAAAERIDQEVERLLAVLAGLIESRDCSAAGIEARLGWERGRVSDLLGRQQPIKYREIFAILAAIGVEPKEFYDLMSSPRPRMDE